MKKFTIAGLVLLAACATPTDKPTDKAPATADSTFITKSAIVFTTADSTTDRITPTDTLHFTDFAQPLETEACVFVDPTHSYQSMLGIGGALTDASAETFAKLPQDKQQEMLKAYYDGQSGIGYTLGRTNIHSCDFSSDTYTYVKDNDSTLQSFSVAHDEKYRIPFIKQVLAAAGGKLTLYCSPWSPPAWMKDNNDMLHGGHLKPEYYQAWANYYVKFIKTYQQEGIDIWGTSIQNEPMATQRWESCIYTAEMERDFLKNYLGPTFQREGLSDKKIIVWDHNRDLLYQRASTILNDPDAAKYVWGVGFHWYVRDVFENVKRVKESFPEKNLLFTEGCNGPFNMAQVNDWKLGETYARSMVHDFNNGAVGWTDWNILLDETGGPNHVQNFCFAPIHADTKTGKLIYTNAYYYIGHFSKFMKPGAKRVTASTNRDQLQTTAFLNEDGKLAIVVLNLSNEKIPYHLWIHDKGMSITSLPHSIATIVL